MNIVYCLDSICILGGIERATITKANALSNINDNHVYIIVAEHRGEPFMPINPKVNIINLEIQYYRDYGKSRLESYKILIEERYKHKERLSKVLNEINPNIVISTGKSERYFINRLKIKSKPKFIREFHLTKNHKNICSTTLFNKYWNKASDLYESIFHLSKFDKLIILTEEEKKYWKNNTKLCVIPNPVNINHTYQSNQQNKIVVAAGRLSEEKNFKSLISAWKEVTKIHPEWELRIWGDGSLRNELETQIKNYNLSNHVILKGHTHNILQEISKASFFVMTSISESFGLVLVEAMSCGLPVISYACPTGPIEIISNNIDGFLVPVNNEKELANKIILLMENKNKRIEMSNHALNKAQYFSVDNIIDKYMNLFIDLSKS